tara:strand:- start:111 stop:320 length:210 start_codon:yes stop_codon:yes gene_type:complete
MLAAEEHYLSIQKEAFPNAELVINVQTGPCSQMSLAIYPSYEDAKKIGGARRIPSLVARCGQRPFLLRS